MPRLGQARNGTPITTAIDNLVSSLRTQPATPPVSAAALNLDPAQVFAPDSDAIPRLVTALHPALAGTLYKALGATSIGQAAVTAAQALQVQATPFGARIAPRPVFDRQGQQFGTDEWPIGDLQVLGAQLNVNADARLCTAQLSLQAPNGASAQAEADLSQTSSQTVDLGNLGTAAVDAEEPPTVKITFDPTAQGLVNMTLTLAWTNNGPVTVTFGDGAGGGSGFTWVPTVPAAQRFTLGNYLVTIGWQRPTPGTNNERALTVSVAEALPLARPDVLDLDTTYPGILPGSWVVIAQAGSAAQASPAAQDGLVYPVVAQVKTVATPTVARYGITGKVTELTLDRPWVDPGARWLSVVRPLSVQARSAALTLLPVTLTGPLAGATIDLDGLYAGIEAGQRIVVTGTRSDLPGSATVPAGEAAMVAAVTQQTTPQTADTPHTTLQLAAPLAYSYQLPSVRIYGNVVPAHQGATVTEPLTGSTPGDPSPSFTLSQAPVLADPSSAASGSASSLRLSVGGRTWTPVTRLDASTPASSYQTGIDGQGRTTIKLSGPLPTGTSSVVATYRTGQGSSGNVRAHQVNQLLACP